MCEAGRHRAGESRNGQKKASCAKGCGALQAKQRSIASVLAECQRSVISYQTLVTLTLTFHTLSETSVSLIPFPSARFHWVELWVQLYYNSLYMCFFGGGVYWLSVVYVNLPQLKFIKANTHVQIPKRLSMILALFHSWGNRFFQDAHVSLSMLTLGRAGTLKKRVVLARIVFGLQ